MKSYFARSTQKSVRKKTLQLQIRHFCDVTKGPRCLSRISDKNLSKLGVWDLSMDDDVGPPFTLFCQSERDSQGPSFGTSWIFFNVCRLDLKGLVSGVSLSPTNNVSDHYNDNQASQSSCDNDWD